MIQSEINAFGHRMPNRLAKESSPYLQQHSDNPVDWYPWGLEALERARAEDKPILLSIGYAACHWCHVMAHESFEDEKTAQVMNEKFINIKVDREERPDIDAIYMQAVQVLTGHGGWPMTMFLLPDGSPFYGGTYYPPEDRQGLPSFRKILNAVADAYVKKRGDISKTSEQIKQIYKAAEQRAQSTGALSAHTLELAYRGLAQQYDGRNGGFGGAPKFPSTMCLDFLLRYAKRSGTGYAQEMALESFRKMARGGIYDQVGGGFHRYAVDAIWLVPHFEKMLYDNALLARFGAHLWQATHDAEVRRVTEETVEWVAREMTSPAGGFYSSLDADSEGHEGKFYVWDESELDQVLGNDSALVKQFFGVTQAGNFEGKNILFRLNPASAVAARAGIAETEVDRIVGSARTELYDERAKRVWPGRDEKVLAGWNGLMLRGVATAARAFGRIDFKELAIRNAEFLASEMVRDGRVMRSHKDGVTTIPGFLEDQAAVALGFISVYELTFDERWVQLAALIAEKMVEFFRDDSTGAFYDTARDAEKLITRPRDVTDNAIPSGNSLAIELLLHLAELKSDSEMKRRAIFALETLGPTMLSYPMAFGHALGAADLLVNGGVEVAISGSPGAGSFQELLNELAGRYLPSLVLAGGESGKTTLALLKDRPTLKQAATAYVCRGYVCDTPTDDPKFFGEQIESAAKSR